MPRTIAFGDIHGCAAALATLIDAIAPQPDDTLVTLGDYVDRGPDSRGVFEQLLALETRCKLVPLLGNHELMLLLAREKKQELPFWLECGGHETLASYGGSFDSIPARHWQFLGRCQKHHETARHMFIHANFDSELPLGDQPDELAYWMHLSYIRPAPHRSGKTVIVGHTPQTSGEILDLGHVVCIDTHCCGAGYLTALDVESRQIWQADKAGLLRATKH